MIDRRQRQLRPDPPVVLAAGRVVAAGASALWLVVAARLLPLSEFGSLSLLLAVGAVLSTVADGGWSIALTHAVARSGGLPAGGVRAVLARRTLAAAVAAALTIVAYLALADEADIVVPIVFSFSIAATAVHSTVTAVFRGAGRLGVEAANEASSRLAVLALGVLLLANGGGLRSAALVYAIADLVSAGALIMLLRRTDAIERVEAVPHEVWGVRHTAPLGGAGFLGVLYNKIDVWLISALRDARLVAVYAAAFRLYEALLIPAGAHSAAVLSATAGRPRDEQRRLLLTIGARALKPVAIAAMGIFVAAPRVLELAFGPDFVIAAGALRLLAVAALPATVVYVLAPIIATEQTRAFLVAVGIGIGAGVMLNFAAIPRWGATGAAGVTLVVETMLAGLLIRIHSRRAASHDEPAECHAAV